MIIATRARLGVYPQWRGMDPAGRKTYHAGLLTDLFAHKRIKLIKEFMDGLIVSLIKVTIKARRNFAPIETHKYTA